MCSHESDQQSKIACAILTSFWEWHSCHLYPVTFLLPWRTHHVAMSLVRFWWTSSYTGVLSMSVEATKAREAIYAPGCSHMCAELGVMCDTCASTLHDATFYVLTDVLKAESPSSSTVPYMQASFSSDSSHSNLPCTALSAYNLPTESTSARTPPLAKWPHSISLLQTI